MADCHKSDMKGWYSRGMRWIKNIIVGALQKRTDRMYAEATEIINRILPELEPLEHHHPAFYDGFLRLCKASGIEAPPKVLIIIKPHLEAGLNKYAFPMAYAEADAIIVGKEIIDQMVALEPEVAMSGFAHELGHVLRRDFQVPGVHIGFGNRGLMIDVSGAHKAMEQSTDALGAHMMMKHHNGERDAGMLVARYANSLAANSQKTAIQSGKLSEWSIGIARNLHALHHGTPAQRLDSVRRAVRIDYNKHATHLDRLTAERNASDLGANVTR